MRIPALVAAACAFTAAAASQPAAASERDFVFTDDEGHLVLRFVGAGPGAPDTHQRDEIMNQEFSVMIHDDLRADILFESERVDSEWAAIAVPRIEARAQSLRSAFTAIGIECRSTTCRMMLEHAGRRSVREHQEMIGIVQDALAPLVENESSGFERSYMVAAYEQRAEIPLVKVYLRRTTDADQAPIIRDQER